MPRDFVVAHGDVERVDHAVGVADGAVPAQEVVVIVARVNQVRLERPQHREALERLGVAQLRLQRHPLAPPQEPPEGLLDRRPEGRRVAPVDCHHPVQAAGQAALVRIGVALERHRHKRMGQERYVHRPRALGRAGSGVWPLRQGHPVAASSEVVAGFLFLGAARWRSRSAAGHVL